MSATKLASKVHKWLALLMAVQILLWFVSGLFFAAVPIERVRSEDVVAKAPPVAIPLATAASGLARLASAGGQAGEKIEIKTVVGQPVALVSRSGERPRLYELTSGRQISPIDASLAARIAQRDRVGSYRVASIARIDAASPEYRGVLPAWRVDFDDGAGRSIYVAADTGAVTARRSTLWRVYDFLWSLHIMDFKGHENFNTLLLVTATSLGLTVILTGFVLFPARLGYYAWRRRRLASRV